MTDKRKVNGSERVVADDLDDRSSKRRKMPNDTSAPTKGETPESTKIEGLRALEHVRTITDKSGRLIHTDFRSLPNKKKFPDYYTFTKLPIALDTLEAKLKRHEFPNLTAFESWFKRMVLNAKEYNEKGSQIYDDAERLRKGFSNYMTKVNPAYKVHGFVVTPVELPGEETLDDEVEPDVEIEEPVATKRVKGRASKAATKSPPPPAWKVAKYVGKSFSGLTFQQAQEKVVEDMILYNDDPKNVITTFEDFVELPPKDLKDYYAVIQDPRSLQTLWEQVQGIEIGKKGLPTGVSKFGNWDEFEAETSMIWANAYHYNEDDSEIFNLAKELEIFFHKELESAKKAVPGPAGAKKIMLKIGGNKAPQPQPPQNPRITLKLPGQKGSPVPSPAVPLNVANGNGTAANGTSRRNPFGGSATTTPGVPTLDQLDRTRSMSGSVASPTIASAATVKHEDGPRHSPAIVSNPNYRAPSQAVSTPGPNTVGMPPPSTPGLGQGNSQSGGFAQSFNHQPQYPVLNPAFESKWRQPGKDASDAMITNLSLSTHPGLNIPNHLQMNLLPSDTMSQQSVTINLPSTHYFLQIKPTIALNLLERQHKLFITLNNQRLHAMPLIPGHPLDPRHPLFEGRLLPGVNRLEIELIASLPKGVQKPVNGPDTELEKITVFANLLKAT